MENRIRFRIVKGWNNFNLRKRKTKIKLAGEKRQNLRENVRVKIDHT